MVGGVSSPVRAFSAVGGSPRFIERGIGSHIWDVDGNKYVDYVLSWGPLILGHAHPSVTRAVLRAAKLGTSYGAPTVPELELAEEIRRSLPSMEKVRFVNSGTEATMSALRLARAYTGRNKLLKFEGCYHGHADSFLTRAGSGLATLDIPASPGVPPEVSSSTMTASFNDISAVDRIMAKEGGEVAAVIVEPVAGNMGVVPPERGFLGGLRTVTHSKGSLLIFDEVITGFRVARTGAQGLLGVTPDLTCLGKVIGGGFPVGAYGGSEKVMKLIAPEGQVYQAGTLSGNPVAMSAGLSTLSLLGRSAFATLERLSQHLQDGLLDAARKAQVPVTLNRVGSMVGLFFGTRRVRNFQDAKATDHRLYSAFHRSMLRQGVYLPPSPFETIFLSTAHSRNDIDKTTEAASVAFRECARA